MRARAAGLAVSVSSTIASAMSGTFASVAPYESCTSASMPAWRSTAGQLRVLGLHDHAVGQVGAGSPATPRPPRARSGSAGPSPLVVELGEPDDVGVGLLDPVPPGDPEVEAALGDVLRDLLRPEDAHLVDAWVVDGGAVVDVGAADTPRSASANSLRVWASREPLGRTRLEHQESLVESRAEKADHLDRGTCAASRPLLPSLAARAGQRLVELVGGEHAEHDGTPVSSATCADAGGDCPRRSRSAACRLGSPRRGR